MTQIKPQYLAKFQELYGRKNAAESQLLRPDLSGTELNSVNAEIKAYQSAIDSYDADVKTFEGLSEESIIDHQTGFVTE